MASDQLRAIVGESDEDLAASADAFALLEDIVRLRVGRGLTTVVDTLGLDADRRSGMDRLGARARTGDRVRGVRDACGRMPGPQPRAEQARPRTRARRSRCGR